MVCFWPAAWRWAAPALSPYLAVCSAVALRSMSLVGLPMLLVAVFRRRFWCRRLCPLGLMLEGCGRLGGRRTQPAVPGLGRFFALATLGGALAGYPLFLWMDPLALFGGVLNRSPLALVALPLVLLTGFLFPGLWCAKLCPLGATVEMLARKAPRPAYRRAFLAAGVGALAAFAPRLWGRRLHPPGSVGSEVFEGACIRCGSCVRACPTRIIQPSGDGLLTPTLRFSGPNYCLQDCNRCGQVCPTGVIRPLPLVAKNRQVIGIARIDLSTCLLMAEVECGLCVPRCPRTAIADGFSHQTYTPTVQVLREKCNGCGACVGICPPRAITIDPC